MRARRGVLGVVITVAVAAAAPQAQAKIFEGRSVAAVKLGETRAGVRARLGRPTHSNAEAMTYAAKGLSFHISNGRVDQILSTSKREVTTKGIGIGASRAKLMRAYPTARCASGFFGPNTLYCLVFTHLHGQASRTGFLFEPEAKGVSEIEVGEGPGNVHIGG
jgi:hypothetical protein